MTKKQYIDFIRNNLRKIDETAKYHSKQVEFAIEQVFNKIYYDTATQSPNDLERYSELLTSVSASENASTGRWESTLTKDFVDLPLKASGVLEVRQPSTSQLQFVPMTTMQMEQAYGLEATLGDAIVGFSAQNGKVEFFNLDEDVSDLVIRIVPKFSEFASTDEVYPPYGKDYDVTRMVLEVLSTIPPVDLVNDNADTRANG